MMSCLNKCLKAYKFGRLVTFCGGKELSDVWWWILQKQVYNFGSSFQIQITTSYKFVVCFKLMMGTIIGCKIRLQLLRG